MGPRKARLIPHSAGATATERSTEAAGAAESTATGTDTGNAVEVRACVVENGHVARRGKQSLFRGLNRLVDLLILVGELLLNLAELLVELLLRPHNAQLIQCRAATAEPTAEQVEVRAECRPAPTATRHLRLGSGRRNVSGRR